MKKEIWLKPKEGWGEYQSKYDALLKFAEIECEGNPKEQAKSWVIGEILADNYIYHETEDGCQHKNLHIIIGEDDVWTSHQENYSFEDGKLTNKHTGKTCTMDGWSEGKWIYEAACMDCGLFIYYESECRLTDKEMKLHKITAELLTEIQKLAIMK